MFFGIFSAFKSWFDLPNSSHKTVLMSRNSGQVTIQSGFEWAVWCEIVLGCQLEKKINYLFICILKLFYDFHCTYFLNHTINQILGPIYVVVIDWEIQSRGRIRDLSAVSDAFHSVTNSNHSWTSVSKLLRLRQASNLQNVKNTFHCTI